MMKRIQFVPTTDAHLIATLNRSIHEHHVAMNPHFFAPYDEENVREAFEPLMTKPEHHFEWIHVDDERVGYVWFEEKVSEANAFRHAVRVVYIRHISIEPRFKRKGYGRLSVERVEQFAKANGFESIELDYWNQNEQAAQFYEELGFEPKRQIVTKSIKGGD